MIFPSLYIGSYLVLYLTLPILASFICENDILVQASTHLLLIYASFYLSQYIWRIKLVPKKRIDPKGLAVLVTGCDTGFGNILARKLDNVGFKVFAACLFPNGNDATALKQDCSSKLSIVKLDVTSDSDALAAYKQVEEELAKYDDQLVAVVNNAGVLATGEVEFGQSMEQFEKQLAVNCLGVIRVTRTFCPLLRRCKKSSPRLVNVNSLASRASVPGLVGYCCSKSAALSFTDGVRMELDKWNIKVISIEPHLYQTNLIALEGQHKALKHLWDTSREITRQDYGEPYFDGSKRVLDLALGTARTNIQNVIDAMYDSVTIVNPETHNLVVSSDLDRLGVWLLIDIIPNWIRDWIFNKITAYITGPTAGVA